MARLQFRSEISARPASPKPDKEWGFLVAMIRDPRTGPRFKFRFGFRFPVTAWFREPMGGSRIRFKAAPAHSGSGSRLPAPGSRLPARNFNRIGGSGMDLRSIAITLNGPVSDPSMLPKWYRDISSTSEVILYPQAIFKDPSRRGQNILVMCDAYTPAGAPIVTNNRHAAAEIFSHPDVVAEVPRYTIVQVYTLLRRVVSVAGPRGPYHCRIIDEARGKEIATSLVEACRYAGIDISVKAGVMPGQWEFQVGPAVGISAGDEFWVARYILERIAENDGIVLSFDPKPIQGDRNGAGSRTNFSTESMRNDGGHEVIRKAMERFALRGKERIWANYFTGCCETADINSFLWGFVASRGGSNGVGRDVEEGGKGFLEYGRPASNMDPYAVTSLIAETTILWKAYYELAWERVWRWVVG